MARITDWINVKVELKNNVFKFYLDGKVIDTIICPNPVTKFYEMSVAPFGYDLQMDWIKMYDDANQLRYFEDFNGCEALAKQTLPRCVPDCKQGFVDYFNSIKGKNYDFNSIDTLYYNNCGIHPDPCNIGNVNNCDSLQHILSDFKNMPAQAYAPALDKSGCDTGRWTINNGGWFHDPKYRMADYIQNGIMQVPAYDSLNVRPNFNYVETVCVNNAFSIEGRLKFNYDPAKINKPYADYYYGITNFEFFGDPGLGINVGFFRATPQNSAIFQETPEGTKVLYPVPEIATDLTQWHIYKIEVKSNNYNIFIDGVLRISVPYTGYFNKLTSFSLASYGGGLQLDWLKMYDGNNQVRYFEDFKGCDSFAVQTFPRNCVEVCDQDFVSYFNKRRGSSFSYTQIDSIYLANCGKHANPCEQELTLCSNKDSVPAYKSSSRCDIASNDAIDLGTLRFNAYQDSLNNVFDELYLEKCMNVYGKESLTVTDSSSEFHFTLYYYDQGGNLVKTVPPEGINMTKWAYKRAWSDSVSAARLAGTLLTVIHGLPTQYRYNTLNQVVQQKTPDAGISNFWYDRLGRLVISQNAKQYAAAATENNRNYSYTEYDALGRITEVGEYSNPSLTAMTQTVSRDTNTLKNWLVNNSLRKQVVRTAYDFTNANWQDISAADQPVLAANLRNRVAYTQYYPLGNANGLNYSQATYYSYDMHGNVDTLIQDYGSVSQGGAWVNIMNNNGLHNRFKRMVYRYDLISGKVNHVAYQPQYIKGNYLYRPADALYHKYEYDAENRLTTVYTSIDSVLWERDAHYDYYKHGPLARTELGQLQVQGLDYAYTIQGWLKGVNSSSLAPANDMGEDGLYTNAATKNVARDAFGFSLNYFNGDYNSIALGAGFKAMPGHTADAGIVNGLSSSNYGALFNGNISSMVVNIDKLNIPDASGTGTTKGAILYNYKYDQLNRLTAMDAYKGLTNTGNSWANMVTLPHYQERISYDANGNILTYKRNGNLTTQQTMDDLSYFYNKDGDGKLQNNRLRHVTDAVTNAAAYDEANSATGVSDLETQAADNYSYDAIGNLVKDTKENIAAINWNVYGKISDINFNFAANKAKKITYSYDASGNRIGKQVEKYGATSGASTSNSYTWYTRDASGNVMAVYNSTGTDATIPATINLGERHLYGSSRLGVLSLTTDSKLLPQNTISSGYSVNLQRGFNPHCSYPSINWHWA